MLSRYLIEETLIFGGEDMFSSEAKTHLISRKKDRKISFKNIDQVCPY